MKAIRSLLLVLSLFAWSNQVHAQFNQMDHDRKKYYFGITGAYNSSRFKYYPSADFIKDDSILAQSTKKGPGFNLGLLCNFRINKRFDVRTLPAIVFGEKNMLFTVHDFHKNIDTTAKFNVQNIYIDVPFQLKLKSDRVQDFRVYMIGGGKYAYDLASLAKARKADKIIRLLPHDVALEIGLGFEFYFPLFILAPEIKLSQGLMNVLYNDDHLLFSRTLQQLKSRTITISLHIQG